MFQTLHLMFETLYNELALAVDLIAERIRALGSLAPASYHEFTELSSVSEDDDRPDATEMIRRLVSGQETVFRTARSIFPAVEGAHDEPTADLLTQRLQIHEKTAWMFRSLLASGAFCEEVKDPADGYRCTEGLRGDGVDLPFVSHAFADVCASVLNGETRSSFIRHTSARLSLTAWSSSTTGLGQKADSGRPSPASAE